MGRKISTRQILITLHKYFDVDMIDFRYKLITGRIAKDYSIIVNMRCNNLSEAFEAISSYFNYDYNFFEKVEVEELIEKKYITKTSIKLAKKIRDIYLCNI